MPGKLPEVGTVLLAPVEGQGLARPRFGLQPVLTKRGAETIGDQLFGLRAQARDMHARGVPGAPHVVWPIGNATGKKG